MFTRTARVARVSFGASCGNSTRIHNALNSRVVPVPWLMCTGSDYPNRAIAPCVLLTMMPFSAKANWDVAVKAAPAKKDHALIIISFRRLRAQSRA